MNPADRQPVLDFVRHLASAVSTASLYPLAHRQVQHLCQAAMSSLQQALVEQEELALLRVDDQLVVAGTPLPTSMYVGRLAQMLRYRGIGHLRIHQHVAECELLKLIGSLASRHGEEVTSTDNLRLGRVELRRPSRPTGGAGVQLPTAEMNGGKASANLVPTSDLTDVPAEELARLMDIYDTTRRHHQLNVVGLNDIVATFIDAFTSQGQPLLVLAPLRDMDEYTFTHSVNVCILNLAQAASLGISGPLLQDIGISAMLHDVGKLFIPEEVLNKPGPLTSEEWQLMRNHPLAGARFLLDTPGVPRMAVVSAFEHHMRFDQRGYPIVKGEWAQNLCSQMTTISDLFDSMMTKRPYRPPSDFETVATTIQYEVGTQLHPILAENFLKLITKLPAQGT
jgi:HD-GYP domain-containing protein (c-di-GMP phosphodiesterase class II)